MVYVISSIVITQVVSFYSKVLLMIRWFFLDLNIAPLRFSEMFVTTIPQQNQPIIDINTQKDIITNGGIEVVPFLLYQC